MVAQQSYRHHYVPQWYQRRFLAPDATSFKILDLAPDIFRDKQGRVRGKSRQILDKGPDAWFYESELYTIRAFGEANDDIEKMLFGAIDETGKLALEAFIEEDWDTVHTTYPYLFEFMDAQRLRTPKGLAFLAGVSPVKTQLQLMTLMQRLRRMHCVMWGEGSLEIFSADHSEAKFIFSDHPVTFFNRFVFPNDPRVPRGQDPLQQWIGTQTIFPLSGNRLMVITHREWCRKQGPARAVKVRTNARLFDNPLIRYDNCQRGRQLTSRQVREVNYIVKSRARRYIAGDKIDDLYPEKYMKSTLWSKLAEFLMPEQSHVAMEGGNMTVRMSDGKYIFQDEYGRRPASKKEYEDKVKEAKSMEEHFKKVLAAHFEKEGGLER